MSLPFPGHERALNMGELKRGGESWSVFLEVQADPAALASAAAGAVRGRVHFVSGGRHRSTAWIFLERTEREVQNRFHEFSAVELWHFVAALEEPHH